MSCRLIEIQEESLERQIKKIEESRKQFEPEPHLITRIMPPEIPNLMVEDTSLLKFENANPFLSGRRIKPKYKR